MVYSTCLISVVLDERCNYCFDKKQLSSRSFWKEQFENELGMTCRMVLVLHGDNLENSSRMS
jgi:hypothetical protein